jgi:hypothetical protein
MNIFLYFTNNEVSQKVKVFIDNNDYFSYNKNKVLVERGE